MKKLKKTLLCFAICAATAATFAACGETAECEHEWGDWAITTPASCTQAGVKARICTKDASHKETDTVPSLGHDWGDWEETPSTCAQAGEKTRICKNDENHTESLPLELAVHSWNPWAVEDANKPTEEEGGKATRTCKYENCTAGAELTEYALPALGGADYTLTDDTAEVGQAGTGTYAYKKDGVEIAFTAATPAKIHEHSWEDWVVGTVPQNYKTGTATRTCSGAGECDAAAADREYTLPKLSDASYSKTEDTATCGEKGNITYSCIYNGETISFNVATNATGKHTVAEWTTTKAPTCGAAGTQAGHCSVCDKDVTSSIAKTGKHIPTEKYNKCAVCGVTPAADRSVSGNQGTINFTVSSEKWYTVTHMFFSGGFIVYTYNGEKPVTVVYSYYASGKETHETVTLDKGEFFYMEAATRGTGYIAVGADTEENYSGEITFMWQKDSPKLPGKLVLGSQTTVNAAADGSEIYEFTATEAGTYQLQWASNSGAVIYKKEASDTDYTEIVSAPSASRFLYYQFTLAEGEKISFQMMVDFNSTVDSYDVKISKTEPTK